MIGDRTDLRKRVRAAIKSRGIVQIAPPGEVKEREQFPRDLTRLSDQKLRKQMSLWIAQLAYANQMQANEEADLMANKEQLRRYEMAHRANARDESGKSQRKWEAESDLAGDTYWEQLRDSVVFSEAMVNQLSRLRSSFDSYIKGCSRELTARLGERDAAEGRGGSMEA